MAQVKLTRPFELPYLSRKSNFPVVSVATLMDAAGEEIHFIGHVMLENPTGGAKTISSAGGKIHWRPGTGTVFANAGTTINLGIQDVSTATSPAQGDGVFDVSAQLIGATDTLTSDTYTITPIEAGSKSISHGQLVSVSFQMSARAGVDSVPISTITNDAAAAGRHNLPAVMLKTAGVFAGQTGQSPNVGIEFDDGTIGWLFGAENLSNNGTQAFNLGSATADEYGNFIQLPAPMTLYGVGTAISLTADTSDFEILLYSNPLTSPSVLGTITVDATQASSLSVGRTDHMFATPILLQKDTPYAITLRPTTANNITLRYFEFGDVKFNKLNGLDGNIYSISRLDNAGAFTDWNGGVAKSRIVCLTALLLEVANDSGGGAGGTGTTTLIVQS